MIWHNNFDLSKETLMELGKEFIAPMKKTFLDIADPSVSVNEKRKLLRDKQVGNGIMGLLASAILPVLPVLLNQHGGSKEQDNDFELKFKGEEVLQRGRGIGGLVKLPKMVFKPFTKTKSNFNGLKYYDDCRTCQQYGRVLHEMEGYDNKVFVGDDN